MSALEKLLLLDRKLSKDYFLEVAPTIYLAIGVFKSITLFFGVVLWSKLTFYFRLLKKAFLDLEVVRAILCLFLSLDPFKLFNDHYFYN